MNTIKGIIKVTFLLKRKSPVNLKPITYHVETDSYVIANEKAVEKLKVDTEKHLLRYFDVIVMNKIELIG